MKKSVLKLGALSVVLLGIVSCTNKEKEVADKKIDELENYIDSIATLSAESRQTNWDQIEADYQTKNTSANEVLLNLNQDDKESLQEKVNASNTKYNDIKYSVITVKESEAIMKENNANNNSSQLLRDRLFGAGKIGSDMSFNWVNKDNILSVYENFFESYKQNKSDFTREDYDEVKLLFEALDSRKNTVEKEGLSSEDNNQIASIKLKFSPMFKMNRIGAKSRENQEAKE
ncbi:hypothetical protein FLCU109888_07445 [Flavobacterium cucumis]|uniref:Lipoprotein n=1 Tax=Flavobacterium cucumis TaxID=416016 RepID=A0A1M7ZWG7_9FLAO|nr:hypothetical protein [Flavobacterium cucumis]SHO73235.1 hypothetical protein SAMN05443547_1590 [Flavobacterium cucumis]